MTKLRTIKNTFATDIWYGDKWLCTVMGPHENCREDVFPSKEEMRRLTATILGALIASGNYPEKEDE